MRWSRHWVSTWIVTSSGMWSPSMSSRHEVEVGLARRREADLDLLVAHPDEQVEHPQLALGVHRVDERLVAVAQVDGAPARGLVDPLGRPGAVGQLHGDLLVERYVLAGTASPTGCWGWSTSLTPRFAGSRCGVRPDTTNSATREAEGQASSRQRRRRSAERTRPRVCPCLATRPARPPGARMPETGIPATGVLALVRCGRD